ncbi:hypothetical protein LSTR_LSTR017375 [Laodelphax striatellus]|uniref:Uncharacterized protein n=1 Tax=Laodelphax striatellus TaxID=195883 RepID=A0A482X6P7_LAOST|nr:hypothetical protein LSTR_LSTR017375 [Laodelphax striatellus]
MKTIKSGGGENHNETSGLRVSVEDKEPCSRFSMLHLPPGQNSASNTSTDTLTNHTQTDHTHQTPPLLTNRTQHLPVLAPLCYAIPQAPSPKHLHSNIRIPSHPFPQVQEVFNVTCSSDRPLSWKDMDVECA